MRDSFYWELNKYVEMIGAWKSNPENVIEYKCLLDRLKDP